MCTLLLTRYYISKTSFYVETFVMNNFYQQNIYALPSFKKNQKDKSKL